MQHKLNWPQRFAVIEHYGPSVEQICRTFGISQSEFEVVCQLRQAGAFKNLDRSFDAAKHRDVFGINRPQQKMSVLPAAPNQATKAPTVKRIVQRVVDTPKRGRQGSKIVDALRAVPLQPVDANTFSQQYDVSIAVLRQSKRFLEKLPENERREIGTVVVKQDRNNKQLMIWRTV